MSQAESARAGGAGAMRRPQHIPAAALALLALMTLFWGVNFPVMKIVLAEIEPWAFRVMCLSAGALGLFAIARARGQKLLPPPQERGLLVLVSILNITGWHLFSAFGLTLMGAGRAAILAYTMPLWAVLSAWALLGERMTATRVLGLLLGFGSLVVLFGAEIAAIGAGADPPAPPFKSATGSTAGAGADPPAPTFRPAGSTAGAAPWGALFMLGAAVAWGVGTACLKLRVWRMSVSVLTGWQMVIGGLPVLAGFFVFGRAPDPAAITAGGWLALAYACSIPMVFCHYAYTRLVGLVPAGVAAIGTLAIPVVGVISSALMTGEPVGLREVAALLLVSAALAIVLVLPAWRAR